MRLLQKIACHGAGVLLLVLGLWTFMAPEICTRLYDVGLPTAEGRIAIQAIIGGGETALGLYILLGH